MTEIRRAEAEDWPLIREIRLRALIANPSSFGSTWEHESSLRDQAWRERLTSSAWFIALENGAPIGVVCSRTEINAAADERELQAMWVAGEARGHNIGRQLIDAARAWAQEDGASTITLWVGPENTAARHVYEGKGFGDTGVRWSVDDERKNDWMKLARSVWEVADGPAEAFDYAEKTTAERSEPL